MANTNEWQRSSMIPSLQREVQELLEEFEQPRAFRRELLRMFGEDLPPRSLWREVERLMDDFFSPPTLRRRVQTLLQRALGLGGGRAGQSMMNVLSIRAERRGEEIKRVRGYEYIERAQGTFFRSLQLPYGSDAGQMRADFNNGVLEVHVPKSESARARRIPIGSREAGRFGGRDGGQPS